MSALKARGIPVAGADRLMLTEQIAVQDLVALGDFLRLPEDDLALAALLKSPLFGLDDDDLLALAPGAQGHAVAGAARRAPTATAVRTRGRTLQRWRARADFAAAVRVLRRRCSMATACARGMLARLGAGGGRRHRRVPEPGARLRDGAAALAAGLPGLAREGTPRDQARHGAGRATRCA